MSEDINPPLKRESDHSVPSGSNKSTWIGFEANQSQLSARMYGKEYHELLMEGSTGMRLLGDNSSIHIKASLLMENVNVLFHELCF